VEILKDYQLVTGINQRLYGKLLGQVIKITKVRNSIRKDIIDLSCCLVPVNEHIVSIETLASLKNFNVTSDLKDGLSETISNDDAKWFDQHYSVSFSNLIKSKERQSFTAETLFMRHTITKGITRWRAAEQQCVELEETWGNTAKDVSKQNLGYDVTSLTPQGTTRYIEVKLLGKGSSSFTLTNNEYSAAHQLGVNYFLCLITQDENKFVATYIQDPINILQLEKRVRQWEWICEDYFGEQFVTL
jgi:hypothetical protein